MFADSARPDSPLGAMLLPVDDAKLVLRLLTEDSSIRSAVRISGVSPLPRLGQRARVFLSLWRVASQIATFPSPAVATERSLQHRTSRRADRTVLRGSYGGSSVARICQKNNFHFINVLQVRHCDVCARCRAAARGVLASALLYTKVTTSNGRFQFGWPAGPRTLIGGMVALPLTIQHRQSGFGGVRGPLFCAGVC